jgi:hypothetical protein
MFIHTEESLKELEIKIKQLYLDVRLKPSTYKEVREAIIKQRAELKTLNIDSVIICSRGGCNKERKKEHSYCLDCRYERTMSGY